MIENIDTDTSSNSRQKTKVTVVTVTKSEGEGTGKDLVCLCFPRYPPALVLICLLLPFTLLNLYKLGRGLAYQDSAARTYMVFSGIIWLLVLPPWLALLVSHTNVSYPYQSSILDKIKRFPGFCFTFSTFFLLPSVLHRLINQLGRCRVFSSQFFSTSSFPGRSWFTGSGKDGSGVKERLRKWLSKVLVSRQQDH